MLTPRGQQEGKKTRNRRHTRRCRKGPVCSMHKPLQDFPGLKKTLRSHCVVRSNGRVKKDPVHSWFPVMSPGSVCGCYCDHKPRTQCVCVCSFSVCTFGLLTMFVVALFSEMHSVTSVQMDMPISHYILSKDTLIPCCIICE